MEGEEKIHSTFAAVASSLGYSEVHGRIISALLVAGRPMSMDELTQQTKYSAASISLSLDLLEIIGIIKKSRIGDRKIYARLEGDLIEGLRNALMLKLQKEINSTLTELSDLKNDAKTKKAATVVEREVKRLQEYLKRLSDVKVPGK